MISPNELSKNDWLIHLDNQLLQFPKLKCTVQDKTGTVMIPGATFAAIREKS